MNVSFKQNSSTKSQIYNHLFKCDNTFCPPLSTQVDIDKYSTKIKDYATLFEAWFDNELVGLLAVYLDDTNKQQAYITNVSVLPSFTGRGIGAALLKQCIDRAQDMNYQVLALEVSELNPKAIQLYKKFGFLFAHTTNSKIRMELRFNPS